MATGAWGGLPTSVPEQPCPTHRSWSGHRSAAPARRRRPRGPRWLVALQRGSSSTAGLPQDSSPGSALRVSHAALPATAVAATAVPMATTTACRRRPRGEGRAPGARRNCSQPKSAHSRARVRQAAPSRAHCHGAPPRGTAPHPVTTGAGSGASGGSCERSCSQREEADERPAPVGRRVADGPAQHGIALLQRVEDGLLRRHVPHRRGRGRGAPRHPRAPGCAGARQHDPITASTHITASGPRPTSTAGRSRTIGAQVSPESAEA
jgi:hypothetical protein